MLGHEDDGLGFAALVEIVERIGILRVGLRVAREPHAYDPSVSGFELRNHDTTLPSDLTKADRYSGQRRRHSALIAMLVKVPGTLTIMDLPVMPPVAPMLSKPLAELPGSDTVVGEAEWLYDPKWDGFRSIVFRDGDEIVLGSRNEKPLTRYFPELVEAFRLSLPDRCVVDGEILVEINGVADFDHLGQRIHPADSRVRKLAAETPARFVAFDLLALGDRDLRKAPLRERRALLNECMANASAQSNGAVGVTPATLSRSVAADWFVRFEAAGCDGIIAKRLDDPYVENKRTMIKVKHQRTADCVVAGFRWHKHGGIVGSLLLGIYDGHRHLNHVGVTAAFTDVRRRELVAELEPLRSENEGHPWAHWAEMMDEASAGGQRLRGAGSRWTGTKDLSFVLLRPERVCEVAFDHLQGDRFRHAATFRRWRPDRAPETCTYDQLEPAPPCTLDEVMAAGEADRAT